MEEPISFWGYKEQETHLILREHDDDDDDDDDENFVTLPFKFLERTQITQYLISFLTRDYILFVCLTVKNLFGF